MSGENESDNILNYSAESRGNERKNLEDFLVNSIFFSGSLIGSLITLALVMGVFYLVSLSVSGSTSGISGIALQRSFTQQLFDIGDNLINEKTLDDLTRVVEKSIEGVTKFYY